MQIGLVIRDVQHSGEKTLLKIDISSVAEKGGRRAGPRRLMSRIYWPGRESSPLVLADVA